MWLKSHFDCMCKIKEVLRNEENDVERIHENDKMIGRLSNLGIELGERCKDLVAFKSVIRKTLYDLYVEAGKSEDNALSATETFWNENLSRSETIANNQMHAWTNTFVCLMIAEDKSVEYGVYESVWNVLYQSSMRKRYLISKEYHVSMLEMSRHLALLESCRTEEARLRTKIRSRQSILDQLAKVREMETKMQEFETMASDSSRLLRGSSLARLEEERFRIRYAKLHPKRLASIAKEVETWEKQNDEIFMLGGVSLADAVEKVRQKLLPLELSLRGAEILGIGGDDDDDDDDTKKKSIGDGGKKKKTRRRTSKGKENVGSSRIARPRTSVNSTKRRNVRRTSGDGKKQALKRPSSAPSSSSNSGGGSGTRIRRRKRK